MDKILGEVFDDYVRKQIKVRQRSLGKTQKDVDDLQVFNASTPWIRLSSSIFIDPQKTKELANSLDIDSTDIEGFNLAKNLVLFAGVSKGDNLQNRIGGVGIQNKLNNAYGFLSDKEQGYKPMPGVTGITTTYKNNGSLKQAQVNITCFTRKQFEALEALYLRLGYTVVLEWGHSVYFDNQGVKQNMNSLSIPTLMFKKPLKKNPEKEAKKAVADALQKNPDLEWYEQDEIYFDTELAVRAENEAKDLSPSRIRRELQETREKTGGNYDGMLAKVSNFSWSLNNDLSYSITLDLISVGDIIDSLKMNVGATNTNGVDTSEKINVQVSPGIQNLATIEINRNTSKLNSLLYEISSLLTSKTIQREYNQATQDLITFKDLAFQEIPTVKNIRENYVKILEELQKSSYQKYLDIQNFLLEQVTLELDSRNALTVYTIITPSFQTLLKLLFEAGYTQYVSYNSSTGSYEPKNEMKFETFYREFGLEPVRSADNTIILQKASNSKSSESIRNKRELDAALARISAFFKSLEPISTGNPETDNIEAIRFLQQSISNNTQSRVLNLLLQAGYLDIDRKYYYPKLKTTGGAFNEYLKLKKV